MKITTYFFKNLPLLILFISSSRANSQNSWNTAAVFNGTSSYYSTLDNTINSTTGEMTVEFWTKLNSSTISYALIGKNQFRIMTSGGQVRVQVAGVSVLYSIGKIDSGKWTHVAVSFSSANDAIKIYLNGSLDNSLSTFTGAFTATTDSLFVGKNTFVNNLNGALDEVRIWKTVRTSTEIQNNYKTHLPWYLSTYYDPNLIFCQTYEFDVYSAGTYFPYGGTHGTFNSDILGDKPSNTVVHNNSMYFTGSSYLESGGANDADVCLTGPVTAEAWIYPTSIGTKQVILDLTSGGTGGYKLALEASGKISWTMTQAGTGNTVLTANKWYHIAVVCSAPVGGNQIASIYINGVYDYAGNYSEMVLNTGKLRIGAGQTSTNYFTGFIDEVRISNFAKTPAEIIHNLHTPILYLNKPSAPQSTVAYNLDGNIHSGTRKGTYLKNTGCRFSYSNDPASPLFHMGYPHELTMDSFKMKHPFAAIPSIGTAGYTYDTLQINSSIALDENKMKVFLSLNHDLIADLRVELISPGGDSIKLLDVVNRPSKSITCILNNQSANLISGNFTDISPIIGSATHFSVFNGKNSKGVWKLKITDFNNGNTGVLNSWGLLLNGVPYVNSTHKLNDENSISVYPNPTSNKNITIHSSLVDFGTCNVQVLNLTGQTIYQLNNIKSDKNIQLSLPEKTPAGSYFIVVSSGSKTYQTKLILY